MKKTKLLKAIACPAAITAIGVPVVSLTSCGQSSVTHLEVTSKIGNVVFKGSTISRYDFTVIATKKDGTKVYPTGWTCDKLAKGDYKVTDADKQAGQVLFVFKYGGQISQVLFKVDEIGECQILPTAFNLFRTPNGTTDSFSTYKELHIFYFGGLNPQAIDASLFNYTFKDKNKADANSVFKVEKKDDRCFVRIADEATINDGDEYTIEVRLAKNAAEESPLSTGTINVSTTEFSGYTNDGDGVTLKANDNGVNNLLVVPEYIYHNGSPIEVIGIATASGQSYLTNISSLILPKSIKKIQDGLFDVPDDKATGNAKVLENIYYWGTTDTWNEISCTDGWQGKHAMGANVIGSNEYVRFSNRYDTIYESQCEAIENKPALSCESSLGSLTSNKYFIKFDYSLIPAGSNPSDFTVIEAIRDKLLPSITGRLAVRSVYLNGKKLKKGTDYEDSGESKYNTKIKLNVTVDKDSKLVVELKTPGSSSQAVWIGAHKE